MLIRPSRRDLLRYGLAAAGAAVAAPLLAQNRPRLRLLAPVQGGGGGGDPLNLPLVQSSSNIFSRIGQIPLSGFDFEFGGAAMAINGNQLYLSGNRQQPRVGRLTLPATVGSSATTSVVPVGTGSAGGSNPSIVSGSLVLNGNLYLTASIDYDGNGDQNRWIQVANLSVGGQGTMCSMNASNGAYVRRLSQCLGHIPAEWQSILGGPCFAFGARLSIISNAQCGYGCAIFNPANVSAGGGSVACTTLLDYPYGGHGSTALEPGDAGFSDVRVVDGLTYSSYPKNANGGTDLFSTTNAHLGTAFIAPGSRSLLFITCHGYGVADNGCRPGSSVNNSPFRIQVVAYDLRDLVAVKNGTKQPYEPRPYAWWVLPGWDTPWGACVGYSAPGSSPGNFCWIPLGSGPSTTQNWLIGLADGLGGFPTLNQIQVWTVASL